jgi:putative acetyltransferase
LAQLNDPESYIIAKGGRVYFAVYANEIVGTVAAYKDSETTFSVIKMGVRPLYQGLGIGRKLSEYLIEDVKKLGCTYLYLESNQKLTPALTLYKSLGFKEIPIGDTPYKRADFKAEMYLI